MNEGLFDVKGKSDQSFFTCFPTGEFYKGERIYFVKHSAFYHMLRNNLGLMADFVKRMA